MSKISIVSRGDQALLIDVSGCSSFKEVIEQLSSTFLNAGQFWQEQLIDLNLGSLLLSRAQVAQILALTNGIGAKPNQVFAKNVETIKALEALQVVVTNRQTTAVSQINPIAKESISLESLAGEVIADSKPKQSSITQESEQSKKLNNSNHDSLSNDQVNSANAKIEQVIVLDVETKEVQVSEQTDDSLNATDLETREDSGLRENAASAAPAAGKRTALCIKQTLRAGQALSHKGDLIIIGDVNAGAEVVAEGDITIWGSLRGIAHAGIDGNAKAEIRALRLQPIQIRIANYIARSPDGPSTSNLPSPGAPYTAETAKLVNGKIRIVHSTLEA